MPEESDKTVYVLGAGFSAAARIPMQAAILQGLLDPISYSFSGIVSSKSERILQDKLLEDITRVRQFIERCFPSHRLPLKDSGPPLEDVFTLLDQTIQSKGHFAGYGHSDLFLLRESWFKLIYGFRPIRSSGDFHLHCR